MSGHDVLTPVCPVCSSPPAAFSAVTWPVQGWCPNTDCHIVVWCPSVSLDANLLDARPLSQVVKEPLQAAPASPLGPVALLQRGFSVHVADDDDGAAVTITVSWPRGRLERRALLERLAEATRDVFVELDDALREQDGR